MLLVVLFDPAAALPSVDCEPPKPDAHTLQRGSYTFASGALVNIAKASRSAESFLLDAYALARLLSSA
jgi:hypothetical protein